MNPIRSFEPILNDDMAKLSKFAIDDLNDLTKRKKHLKHLKENRLCICLCQGGAWQHVHGNVGIKDFDVWTFFKSVPGKKEYPPRRFKCYDYGQSKFGTTKYLIRDFEGRKVDILGRSILVRTDQSYEDAIVEYLESKDTKTSKLLAEKSVVIIWPPKKRGDVIWKGPSPLEPTKKKVKTTLK